MNRNILIITAVFPPEPVVSAQLSFDIAKELANNNSVTVLSPKPTRPHNFNFDETINNEYKFSHKVVNSFTCPQSNILGRFYESYSFGIYCSRYIKKNHSEIDCIYINSWPLFAQYIIIKAAKKKQIPCITHIQDIYPESFANKFKFINSIIYKLLFPIDKYVVSNSTNIICISENMKNHIIKTRDVLHDKITVVSNWQNEEAFITFSESNFKIEKKDSLFTFMYLGNNGPVAGVDFLIKAFILAQISNSKLIIAGSGSKTEYCKKLAKELRADNIEFISVPEGKVPEIQNIADVMLLPVKKNGAMSSIPSKLPAYMFSSKPIIGSLDLISDTAKAILDSNCGLVVEPENIDSLVSAMREISQWSNDKLKQRGKDGFDYAIKHFSKTRSLQKIISLITQNLKEIDGYK